MRKMMQCFKIMALITLFFAPYALAAYTTNMTPGVTPISGHIYALHITILYICAAIGILVFGVMIYAIIYHRKSRGHLAANFHENTTIEIIWTLIPFIILIAMAIPATKVLLAMDDTQDAAVTIKITGYQWKWHYDYINEEISFFSNLATQEEQINNLTPKGDNYLLEVDNILVVPIHKKIRFLTTASDVIHSWWIPAFGIKKDAVPGFINEAWAIVQKPGIYRGQCAELCGAHHGFMPIVVKAVTEEEYAAWVTQTKKAQEEILALNSKVWTLEELMLKGEKIYTTVCAMCHQKNGQGLPPAFPSLVKSPITTGDIKHHINIVLHGKPGTAMQAFGKQLNAADLAAVITYERNAWGNNMQDLVQPKDIRAENK